MLYQIRINELHQRNEFWRSSDLLPNCREVWGVGYRSSALIAPQVTRPYHWDGLVVQFYETHEVWTATSEDQKLWLMMNQPPDAKVIEDTP